MDEVHHTEADGLEATWRPTHWDDRKIEIMKVHTISGGAEPDVMFEPGTPARRRHPTRPALLRLSARVVVPNIVMSRAGTDGYRA